MCFYLYTYIKRYRHAALAAVLEVNRSLKGGP